MKINSPKVLTTALIAVMTSTLIISNAHAWFFFDHEAAPTKTTTTKNVNTTKKNAPTKAVTNKTNVATKISTTNTQDQKALAVELSHIKGIYLTQYTLENTVFVNHLISRAKAAGINTFVIDLEKPSKKYEKNIQLLKENNIRYVARIIMFPGGGTPEQIKNPAVWQKKYVLVKQAVNWGAKEIQLDYIRYNTKQKASPQNAKDILAIIAWYKNQLKSQGIPLQVDVFGIASFGESKYIGQNIKLFSESVDAICPMVYPSHYFPFPDHFKKPYETVYVSLQHIKKQFTDRQLPMKVYAYIELINYHYPMPHQKTLDYIKAQMNAVKAAGANGWYAWSPHNKYENLFNILIAEKAGKPLTTGDFQMDSIPAARKAGDNKATEDKPVETASAKPIGNTQAKPYIVNYEIRKH